MFQIKACKPIYFSKYNKIIDRDTRAKRRHNHIANGFKLVSKFRRKESERSVRVR